MSNSERISSLDGLRALSICLVLFSHFASSFDMHIDNLGNFGVKIFFVISGFLITTILVSEYENTETVSLKKFYFRRTLRIFPAYYFYIFFIFLMTILGVYNIPSVVFISPLTYTSNYLTTDIWELGHSWSLSVEEQFYLIYPGLFLLLGLDKIKKVLVFVVIIAPVIRLLNLMYLLFSEGKISEWFIFGFHTNMDALAVGCLLALYRKNLHADKNYQKLLNSNFALGLVPLIAAAVLYNSKINLGFFTIGWTVLNLTAAFALDWLITNSKSNVGRLFNFAPIKYMGVLSYSIYLWQQPFSKYSENLVWTHYPFNIIMIIIFSLVSHYLVEKSFLKLRQNLEKNYFVGINKEKLKGEIV